MKTIHSPSGENEAFHQDPCAAAEVLGCFRQHRPKQIPVERREAGKRDGRRRDVQAVTLVTYSIVIARSHRSRSFRRGGFGPRAGQKLMFDSSTPPGNGKLATGSDDCSWKLKMEAEMRTRVLVCPHVLVAKEQAGARRRAW